MSHLTEPSGSESVRLTELRICDCGANGGWVSGTSSVPKTSFYMLLMIYDEAESIEERHGLPQRAGKGNTISVQDSGHG